MSKQSEIGENIMSEYHFYGLIYTEIGNVKAK